MITSFRLRLALLSVLLSGLALAAFGFAAWWQIRRMRLARLDNDVRAHAQRESGRRRDEIGWQRTAANMLSEIGVHDAPDLLLLVQDGSGNTVYRSPGWPANLDTGRLPWPKAVGRRGPPPPDRTSETQRNPDPRSGDGQNLQRQLGAEAQPGPPPVSDAVSQRIAGRDWHVGLATTANARVAVAVDARTIDAEMRGIRNAFFVAMPLALVLIGIGGWVFSGRALRPVHKLTGATRSVTAAGLDQRLSPHGEDREFVELIQVFNGMLERLERSFKQAYRFSTDAAHELKTPLAILQGQLERAIHSVEEGSSIQVELSSILDEVRRLSTISRKLLLLAQADAGRLNIYRERFNLSKVLADLVEDIHMLAPHLEFAGDIQVGLVIEADDALLRQVLHNLVSNAIKYNVERGWIRISAAATARGVEVSVANSSPGIPTGERDKVFERFYRGDSARSRRVDGVGLGLSVSREIARAHGGDISLQVHEPGSVEFRLNLPSPVLKSVNAAVIGASLEKHEATGDPPLPMRTDSDPD